MDRDTTNTSSEIEEEPKRRAWYIDIGARLVREKPMGLVGGVVTLALLLIAIFALFQDTLAGRIVIVRLKTS